MPPTSPGYSITVRVEMPAGSTATAALTNAVGSAGGALTALDVVESQTGRMVVDVTCDTSGEAHADLITKAIAEIPGATVRKVSDRTFLMHLGGKIEVTPKVPLKHRDDLSRAYTPGVARVCLAIAEHPEDARRLTIKRNTVAVVTDGSAVLGLGNIGAAAALPVMEGKAALFKQFGGVDAWPVCLDTQDTDTLVEIVRAMAPVYGGINLEDISAPRCFEIEARLRELLDIPVFHDDQHGTAIVVLAALTNALRVVDKRIEDVRIVVSGVGAAGNAIIRLLLAQGAGEIIGCAHVGKFFQRAAHAVFELAGLDIEARAPLARDQRVSQRQRGMRHVGAADVEGPGDVLRIRHQQRIGAQLVQLGLDALELVGGAFAGELDVAQGDRAMRGSRAVAPQRVDWIIVDRHQRGAGIGAGLP